MTPSKMTSVEFRKWRADMGWTQEFSAKKLGVNVTTINNYERGKRTDNGKLVRIPLTIALNCKRFAEIINTDLE